MKPQLIASLILSTLASAAFALPGNDQPPLIEQRSSQHSSGLFELSKTQPDASQAEQRQQLFAKGQKRKAHTPRA